MDTGNSARGSFGSQLGVILASAGSAVGLGNIWRFPTEVGRGGGAAFILIYLGFILLLAMPVMLCEFIIGRSARSNAIGAFQKLAPGKPWIAAGIMGVLGGFLVLSFYSVVAGWTLHYTIQSALGQLQGQCSMFNGQSSMDFGAAFNVFVSDPWQPIIYLAVFLLLTHLVVARGIQHGIERYSKLMMPLLLVIILLLVCFSLTMPGAAEGVRFLLQPDLSEVTPDVVLGAMGQAFFSLSVGLGCLVTYSSYFSKETRLVNSAMNVCIIDTMVAVLSGFIIFPTVFSVGIAPDAGPGLVFITLPNVFNLMFGEMPVVGYVFALLFYVLLLLAALTSSISMHEICTAFISEHFQTGRRRAATIVTLICLLLGAFCSLSFGPWQEVTVFGKGFFDLFDFTVTKFLMPLGGLLMTLFVGWYLDRRLVEQQLTNDEALSVRTMRPLLVLIRWVAPIGILVIFLNELFPLFI
ncbi:MAG: sodium-dependent transporter [Bacteroidaceae bacterium]|nr:sodium-dependent transporter [Bacteroidaceae bacterium]